MLVSLETTAAPNEAIETRSRGRYVLAWGCDPGNRWRNAVWLAYNERTGAVAASASLSGTWRSLGSNALEDRAALFAEIACTRLGSSERLPLPKKEVQQVARIIAQLPAD